MRVVRIALLLGLGALPVQGLASCVGSLPEICEGTTCGADGGTDGSVVDWPDGCVKEGEPKDSAKCLDDKVGVFVSAVNGSDETGDGSRAKPLKTVVKAVAIRKSKPRIYVCEGTYEGAVDVDGLAAYGGVFGGWACDGAWSHNGKRAVIHAAAGAIGLRVRNGQSVTVADVDVVVDDATAKGGSSIAGLIANSAAAVRRSSFTAGKGQAADDQPADGGVIPANTDLNGNAGAGDAGGAPRTNPACTSSVGGNGGDPGTNGNAGDDGTPKYTPGIPDTSTGEGQNIAACRDSSGFARPGSHGPGGAFGASATTYGSLTADGFTPTAGQAGQPGGPGQGGGGGASTNQSGGGGGGGAGGCGGAGGLEGVGGGASIALALVNATLNIDADSRFAAKEAGKGGNGGGGQKAQVPGRGGDRAPSTDACNGAGAGAGGSGGGGGGGAGGISIGILWSGEAPTIKGDSVQDAPIFDGVTTGSTTAAGGIAGSGGAAVVSSPPPGSQPGQKAPENGKAGVSRAILKL